MVHIVGIIKTSSCKLDTIIAQKIRSINVLVFEQLNIYIFVETLNGKYTCIAILKK